MKRILFIVNPISGTTGKKKTLAMIDDLLDHSLYDYEVRYTEYAGHATELSRTAANSGVDIVCAIGGDGTVNETARGLVHTASALAIIPLGSGNGLARHLHIPTEPRHAIEVINSGNTIDMDYGIVNERPFFCTCGVGFDAFISLKFAEAGKRGPLTYLEKMLTNGFSYMPETYDIELLNMEEGEDLRLTQKAYVISCANASQYGNNAYIAPEASVQDGMMDVTVMEPLSTLEAPMVAVQLFTGGLERNSRVKTYRCRHVVIRRSEPGALHYDGDPVMADELVDVQLVAGGLRCVCPGKEGRMKLGESINSLITEQLRNLVNKSEEMIQGNIRKLK